MTPRGPPFTTQQDTLAETGTGPPAWTVLYTAAASLMPAGRVAFRPLAGLTAQTCLAVLPGPPGPALRHLLGACTSANAITSANLTDVHESLRHDPS